MIFKIFSPKNFANKLAFFTQTQAKLFKNLIITLVFEKNAKFFAENCLILQKIVVITSTPGFPDECPSRMFAPILTLSISSFYASNHRQE
jgi:hypothetical protein